MPSIKRRLCPIHGIINTNRCELCHKQTAKAYDKTARNKDNNKLYHSARWKKVRIKQLSMNPLCINFDTCHNVATIADHIKELVDGGEAFSLDNIQSICKSCHNTKTSQERDNRVTKFRI